MLKKIDKWVSYAENAMLVIGMLSTTFILFANVIMRFCFKSGIVWSNEYANYAIIWIVCGGCGACVRSDAHMKITAIGIFPCDPDLWCPSGWFHDGQQPEIRGNADPAVVDLSVLPSGRRSDDFPLCLKSDG